jgi:tetratricopeptide (TPR) repeat protein
MDRLNIFISYSWNHPEADEYKKKIISLQEKLKEYGFNAIIDRDKSLEEDPDSEMRWGQWMVKKIHDADVVISVCSENYKNCVDKNNTCIGYGGVEWEGGSILEELKNKTTRVEMIAFYSEDTQYIPIGFSGYNITTMIDVDKNWEENDSYNEFLVRLRNIHKKKYAIKESKAPVEHKTPFRVPFESKGEGAIGLESKLKEVHEALQDPKSHKANIGQVTTFQGMGGLGKTQLAVEYAYRYKDAYDGVVWLTVDQDVESQIIDMAEDFAWIAKGLEGKLKLTKAKSHYAALENTLLIYDNVEEYETEVEPLIPKSNTNKILITSRNNIGGFTSIALSTMESENALALLLHESGREVNADEKEAVEALLKELDGLPLAIEMAGAYMAEADLSWDDYWQLFQKQKISFLEKSTIRGSGTNHENNIGKTLAIGEAIFTKTPLLREIIHLLAFGAPEPMSKILLSKMLGIEAYEVAEAIQEGTKLKYIKKEDEEETPLYTLHRLVREVWKSQHELENEFVEKTASCLATYLHEIKDEYLNLSKVEMASFQAKIWTELTEERDTKALLLSYTAYPHYYQGEYKKALELVDKAYEIVDREQNSNEYAEILTYKAYLLNALGNAKEALPYFKQALEMYQRLYEEDHPDVADSLNNMGSVLKSLGNAKEALPYYKQALEMRQCLYEEDHPDVADSLNNMGYVLASLGNAKDVLPYFKQALEMRQRLYEEDHPDVAESLNNMGSVLKSLGNAKDALPYYKQALEMRQCLYEEDHPDVAGSLYNTGALLYEFKQCHKAKGFLEEAKNMIERLGYDGKHLSGHIANYLKRIEKSIKNESKSKFNKKGRYCVDG